MTPRKNAIRTNDRRHAGVSSVPSAARASAS
jgi:hypothetical protein